MTEVSVEHGAANVTVAHVVERSGVSRRTFYELFEDGEECLVAAVDEALARLAERVLPAYGAPGRWRDRIRAGLVALLAFLDDEPNTGRLLLVEMLGSGPGVRERRARILASVAGAVEEGRGEAKDGKGPTPLTAEGIVGGVLSVLHSRLLDRGEEESLLELTGSLMSMIVLPYLGQAAARSELARPVPQSEDKPSGAQNPLLGLEMRLTYRTVRVLATVAESPGASNRDVGLASGIQDQGQISKLLNRLHRIGLIENTAGHTPGAANAWTLTHKGHEIQQAIGGHAA